jgi:D-psicose/D-tagatose/L-ribulose 3-epimerase
MKLGVNTFIWTAVFDKVHLPLLPQIKAAGFDGVEVSMFDPATFAASDIRRGLDENGLECTICSVMTQGHSLISEDAAIRRRSRTRLADCVKKAAEVGAKIIAGPLYSPVGYLPGRRRNSEEWNWCVEAYQEIGPILTQHGVTIAIEPLNRFETYFLNIATDAVKLCDEINHPKVGILFDTFHANIEEKDIAQGYRTVARHLKHVHTCENDRGIPGTGHIEWPEVFQTLREIHYDGWLTIESFGFALGEISAAASIWRDLAPTPDSIAFEGVKFLRANIRN